MLAAVDSIYAHAGPHGTHGVVQSKPSFLLLQTECWSESQLQGSSQSDLAGGVSFLYRRYIHA